MKKVLLLVVLLALLLGVSAIKTYREHQQRQASYEKGEKSGSKELAQLQEVADSLQLASGSREVVFGDSLTKLAKQYRGNLDSLEDVIDSQQAAIQSLNKKVAVATTKAQAANKAPAQSALSAHEKILDYYKKRYADLPGDLSDYEKKVAVNEIREETAKRFSISIAELEKIRQANNLNY